MPDKEEYKLDTDYIINVVQDILNKNHTDPRKFEIKISDDRKSLNFCCPICGDGKGVRFRSHLYFSNLYHVCYNERETDSMSFTKFCKHFGVEIDIEKRMDIYRYLDNNWKYTKKEDFAITNMDKLIDLEEFFIEINKNKTFLKNTSVITNGSIFHKYLTDRKIYNFDNIRCGYYHLTDKWAEPVIIMLNRTSDKLLSIQLRNLKSEKNKRIYKFMNFQEIYNILNDEQLDEIESVSYNKLSAIFNVLNVDFENTVYVFEGFLDSLFFPNSMALVGLDTDISMFSDENVDIRFVLDNDDPGLRKSKKMLDQGHSIFLWKKLIRDLSKGKGIKYARVLEEAKDINKMAEIYNNSNIYYDLNLKNYFAVDQFDLIDM